VDINNTNLHLDGLQCLLNSDNPIRDNQRISNAENASEMATSYGKKNILKDIQPNLRYFIPRKLSKLWITKLNLLKYESFTLRNNVITVIIVR
jgi:hypothetical protein